MVFEKRMIILTGDGNLKGTVKVERNALGLSAAVSLFGLPDGFTGATSLTVISDGESAHYDLGHAIRRGVKIELKQISDIGKAHFAVCDASGAVLAYGTLGRRPGAKEIAALCEKGAEHEQKEITAVESIEAQTQKFAYSKRDDLFYDIFPPSGGYDDNAVAAVNYYDGGIVGENEAEAEKPTLYNEKGIRMEIIADRNERGAAVASAQNVAAENEGERACISDLTHAFVKSLTGRLRISNTGKDNQADKNERGRIFANVAAFAQRAEKIKSGSAELIPQVPQEEETQVRGRKLSYYEQVSEQIEKLFDEGERDKRLEELMPYTKWVRVDFSGDGKYYVVGLIGEKPDYVCYGLPAVYSSAPPEELGEGCGWLPLDIKNPHGEGYWLLYQDAETGESVHNI